MKIVILVGIFAAAALEVAGAPALQGNEEPLFENQHQFGEFLREAPSQYAAHQYVTPCAAAAAGIHMPGYSAPYQPISQYQGYGNSHYYNAPHYRSIDEHLNDEIMAFSDMDIVRHMPMARLGGYGPVAAPALSSYGGSVLSGGASNSAYGVFPNANVGGCSVPLLFSCTPTIVSGRMMPQSHGVQSSGSESYRLVDEAHHSVPEHHEELLKQHVNPVPETSHTAKS